MCLILINVERQLMKIKVKFLPRLRMIIGLKEVDIEIPEGSTVMDLLEKLRSVYGDSFKEYIYDEKTGEPSNYFQYLVDGKNICSLDKLDTKLNEGEIFSMVIPTVGG